MADNTQSFVDGLANAPAPELTLTPQLDDQASATTALAQPAPDFGADILGEEPEAAIDDSMLTDEERKSVEAFSRQIDLTDSTMILSYGAGAQKKMADFLGGGPCQRAHARPRRGRRPHRRRGDRAARVRHDRRKGPVRLFQEGREQDREPAQPLR